MKAVLNDKVVAEADKAELIYIEGNWYFPPTSAKQESFSKSPTPYTCPWKGVCQYWNVDGAKDAAWSYPEPMPSGIERVGKDFSGYYAFDQAQVQVTE
ncbi:MAG TPA: DUF427 domain-containing protein [Candidatus Microsaccharimonas sp.]|nr:DUF427 domain-containing protein [Candidatus Microsaccharimonas sp.]